MLLNECDLFLGENCMVLDEVVSTVLYKIYKLRDYFYKVFQTKQTSLP